MRAVLVVMAVLALAAAGCQWVPGTDAYKRAQGEKLAASLLRDPSSAQFRNVRVVGRPSELDVDLTYAVCGEINGRNAHGAYAGFARFIAAPEDHEALIDPGLDVSEGSLREATERCQQEGRRAERTGFTGAARFQCDLARDELDSFQRQLDFDGPYNAFCRAGSPISPPVAPQ